MVYDDFAGLASDTSFQAVMGGNFADGKGNMVMNFQYEDIGTVFTREWDRYYDVIQELVIQIYYLEHMLLVNPTKDSILKQEWLYLTQLT